MATPKQLIKRSGGKTARIDVTPEGLRVLTAMAAAGQDQHTMAKRLGLGSATTLRGIAKRDDAVQEALDVGHAVLADEVTHLLLEQGRKGNTVALIFLSKARLGWSDQGVLPDARPNITIVLPDAKTPDAYLQSIAEANARALPPIAPKGITLQSAPRSPDTDDNQTVVYSG
jgi:hypothetical protein